MRFKIEPYPYNMYHPLPANEKMSIIEYRFQKVNAHVYCVFNIIFLFQLSIVVILRMIILYFLLVKYYYIFDDMVWCFKISKNNHKIYWKELKENIMAIILDIIFIKISDNQRKLSSLIMCYSNNLQISRVVGFYWFNLYQVELLMT